MQTFFGPWSLRVTNEEGFFSERFEIAGSAGTDGRFFPPDDGTPLDLAVDGPQWTLDFQAKIGEEEWFSYDPDRTTEIINPQGLTVTLAIEPIVKPSLAGAIVFNHHMRARLVSQDPDLNPPWPAIPIDLTLPD